MNEKPIGIIVYTPCCYVNTIDACWL